MLTLGSRKIIAHLWWKKKKECSRLTHGSCPVTSRFMRQFVRGKYSQPVVSEVILGKTQSPVFFSQFLLGIGVTGIYMDNHRLPSYFGRHSPSTIVTTVLVCTWHCFPQLDYFFFFLVPSKKSSTLILETNSMQTRLNRSRNSLSKGRLTFTWKTHNRSPLDQMEAKALYCW